MSRSRLTTSCHFCKAAPLSELLDEATITIKIYEIKRMIENAYPFTVDTEELLGRQPCHRQVKVGGAWSRVGSIMEPKR